MDSDGNIFENPNLRFGGFTVYFFPSFPLFFPFLSIPPLTTTLGIETLLLREAVALVCCFFRDFPLLAPRRVGDRGGGKRMVNGGNGQKRESGKSGGN